MRETATCEGGFPTIWTAIRDNIGTQTMLLEQPEANPVLGPVGREACWPFLVKDADAIYNLRNYEGFGTVE